LKSKLLKSPGSVESDVAREAVPDQNRVTSTDRTLIHRFPRRQRGVRVNTVTSELGGEKIDIIEWNEDPAKSSRSLSPAKVISIELKERRGSCDSSRSQMTNSRSPSKRRTERSPRRKAYRLENRHSVVRQQ